MSDRPLRRCGDGGGPGRPGSPPSGRHRHRRRRSGPAEGGQATVELVLVVPVVVLLALVVVQVAQVVHHQLLVAHVAREASRAAAVAGGRLDPDAIPGLEHGLDPERLSIDVTGGEAGGHVRVRVTYRDPTDVALVGVALPDVDLEATVVMRAEG